MFDCSLKFFSIPNKKRQFAILSFNICFFLIMAYILPIRFEVCDDVTMCWMASGFYTGTPDCHLVYINAIYGSFIAFLYRICPSIEWYAVCFSILHIISMTIVVNYYAEKKRTLIKLLPCILFFYSFWALIIIKFQFTTTSALVTFAAMLLFIERKLYKGCIMLVLGSMIRFSAAGLVGLLFLIGLIHEYRFYIKQYWYKFLIIGVIVLGVKYADTVFYQTEEWCRFTEWNGFRGKISDSTNLKYLDAHIPDNISYTDYASFRYGIVDPSILTAEKLESLCAVLKEVPLSDKISNVIEFITWNNVRYQLLFIFIITAVLICLNRKEKNYQVELIVCTIFFYLILCIISLTLIVKERVFYSALLALSYYWFTSKIDIKKSNMLTTLVFLFLCIGIYRTIYYTRVNINNQQSSLEEQLDLIEKSGSNRIMQYASDSFNGELVSPYKLSTIIPKQKLLPYGWWTTSPIAKDLESYLNYVDSDIYILAHQNESFKNLITSLDIYNGVRVTPIIVESTNNFILIKICK